MDPAIQEHLNNLHSSDKEPRYASFQFLLKETNKPVPWVYQVWDDLFVLLKNGDNHQRAIAAQLLSNLAKSDSQQRILSHFDELMKVTRDEKFVTARHSLQSLWKIGVVANTLRDELTGALDERFKECIGEKNCTLIRYDIIVVFKKMFDAVNDEKLRKTALALIECEPDPKYRKKYLGVWKDVLKPAKK